MRAVACGVIRTDPAHAAARPARRARRRTRRARRAVRALGGRGRAGAVPDQRPHRDHRRAGERARARVAAAGRRARDAVQPERGEARGHRRRPRRQASRCRRWSPGCSAREIPKPPDAADALALACCHVWRAPARRAGGPMIGSVRGTVIERSADRRSARRGRRRRLPRARAVDRGAVACRRARPRSCSRICTCAKTRWCSTGSRRATSATRSRR